MFVWQNNDTSEWRLPGIESIEAYPSYSISKFDLTLELYESDDEITGSLEYSTVLFDRQTVERHIGYLRTMLQAMTVDQEQTISNVDLLTPAERELLLRTWNETHQDYPTHSCIHHLFEQQVERNPQATALVFMNESLSYSELNNRANRLAHHLIGLGVQPDMRVAICVERSFSMIIGVLAILKAGGAYVPLDPNYPKERLAYILGDADTTVALVDTVGHLSSVTMLDPNDQLSSLSMNPDVPSLASHHLAYVVYTSGSTGNPKGVMIEHRGVVNYALSRIEDYGLDTSSRVLQFSSLNFDLSVIETFTAFYSGASLHLLDDRTRLDRKELWGYMERHLITQAVLPPAILQECKGCAPLSTRLTLISCGEELPTSLLRELRAIVPNGVVINEYGPTETAIGDIAWRCPDQDFDGDMVPIGRPLNNKRVYILDKRGRPAPIGSVGELYIGGVGIARGYLNRPELTAKAFVPDPFSGDQDARMYKTGDLARYLPDGNIVFLGRNDHQIKIRGFRIELGEIEARLVDHTLVDKAAVIAMGEGGDKRLVAYVVAKPNDQLVNSLRTHLSSRLPDYMVPAAIVRLDALPLTSNGKLDRKALPAPDNASFARKEYEEPRGEIETRIASIWAELLHLDQVSRNDNFFALGGHSLLAVQLMERLRRIGFSLPVSSIFKSPTLSVLVKSLGQLHEQEVPPNLITPDTSVITPDMLPLISLTPPEIDLIVKHVPGGVANVQDIYSLSPLQEGILFHHLLATKGDPYLLIVCKAFATRDLLDRYLDAVQQVVNRQDILRTAFIWDDLSTPAQVVWRQASLSITELHLDLADGPIADQLMQRLDPRHHRIDLTQAPLLRFTIAPDNDGRWILAEQLHHLIGDHSTLEAMNLEIKAFMEDRGNMLPVPQPFRNMIAQARSGRSQEDHEKFFNEMLGDIDTPSLPFGLANVHGQGDEITTSYQPLPQDLNDRLRRQAKQMGVSVASLCHLAWAQVVSRTCGEIQVVFGTVLFGRMQSGLGADSAMGLFINTLPLRVDLNGTVHESVLQTHAKLASLLEHEHASLVLAQRCSNVPQGTPLFSSILNYRHNASASDTALINPGIEYLQYQERTNYPLTISIEDYGTELGLTVDVIQPLDPKRVCGYMQQALQSLTEALGHKPDMLVHQLEVLHLEERKLLLQTWNETQQHYPKHRCIHQVFEQQVESTPQATALVFMDQSLSYSELNTKANRLAHHLIGLGVQPDTLVAICVERSFAMIIGVLAVLKAGGAYVPLDPTYSSDRLRDILTDAAPSIIVADEFGQKVLKERALSSVAVVDPNAALGADHELTRSGGDIVALESLASDPQVPNLTSHQLAYVIYTSGSTGKPKGVMVEHQGVVNLVMTRPDVYGISASSRVMQFFSFAFDCCVLDIFMTLCLGGSLHLLTNDIRSDPAQLWDYLQTQSITQALIPPAILQDCKDLQPLSMPLTLIVAGEALPLSLLRHLQTLVPNGRIINGYGPTEATVISIIWKCSQDFDGDVVPIGHPISNNKIYILDKQGRPVPLGAVGELYIGGVGVARGYLNRPELTAEAFLPDPFAGDQDARMYKTGDLARYLPDGNIVFLGRNDHQVKIRGFRIELGEIEERIVDHILIDRAAVIAM
ncbi:hypothetical protein BGZ65_004258, partial [Modicella reniformis]